MEILRVEPEEAVQLAAENESLTRLIREGYPLSPRMQTRIDSGAIPDELLVMHEFGMGTEHQSHEVFLVKNEERFIGLMPVTYLDYYSSATPAWLFWSYLMAADSDLVGRAVENTPIAMHMNGFLVAQDQRSRGVATELVGHAVSTIEPSIVLGQTKNVGAISAIRRVPGNRTFLGDTEVTPRHPNPNTDDHADILDAYLFSVSPTRVVFEREGTVYRGDSSINATPPSVFGGPQILHDAFSPIVRAQERVGNAYTVMAPIVGVSKKVLPFKQRI